jgi:hypothetical protein
MITSASTTKQWGGRKQSGEVPSMRWSQQAGGARRASKSKSNHFGDADKSVTTFVELAAMVTCQLPDWQNMVKSMAKVAVPRSCLRWRLL